MRTRSLLAISGTLCVLAIPGPALAFANRVFVSARSGNNLNSCDNISTPCQTLAGAVSQLNPNGEAIVLDSGGYGPVTITQGVTIEAPAGVTAFIHPPSGDAITVNAGSATVTLRGLVLNVGTGNGITVNSVGTLNVESCFISGFTTGSGIRMGSAGRLNVKDTDIKNCFLALNSFITSGTAWISIDGSHLDQNQRGFVSFTASPGMTVTSATRTTANGNTETGWTAGNGSNGIELFSLEFCTGSANTYAGLGAGSTNAASVVRYSNCIFANNTQFGVEHASSGSVASRGNNTITGNGTSPTTGNAIGSFSGN